MAWFFSRRKPRGETAGPIGLVTGSYPSPGLAALCNELDRRRVGQILDLGSSSTANIDFFHRYCDHVTIQDVARSSGIDVSKPRSTPISFDDPDAIPLPEEDCFDVVLLWDVLHYVERSRHQRFIARLRGLSRQGALYYFLASANAPMPAVPVQFKIEARDRLHYGVAGERLFPAPRFTVRGIEQLMHDFEPLGLFQLRNGVQEFLFQFRGAKPEVKVKRVTPHWDASLD